ncbi:DUF6431 domain-containing protein [Anaerobacillus isosaccharinicus]|uniref:DUF6431 domain-containing protein n=7 Tax=Anaerobacillus isosaccharinicus TaxID=1532552 RepID=A0A7S7L5A2_9BACI|nr:DUF6431 domain-containing protein [Anaerobacillus isosaccharinicus]MBA5585068.1 hypothetical protein [Anaerobacillus isosaccharinicus]MBA5585156.1 hypothetical protein [Anaerobacillus isosaccharinicus]MBA5585183.1 hypothetical protein [Anaerobacillus isosaccharinicus]MBA5586206.1 hypothetical protein [Anaerobacillus isosaccharinicus]MBA5587023.1 hypothetical protein [Anaerobacillus isosaccharinicus]
MIILLDSPRSIKKYNDSINKYDVELRCPCCGRRMKKHGKYKRWVHMKHQSSIIFVLRRRCGSCDRTFSLLPCFLTPWSRFSNVFREFIARWLLMGVPLTHLTKRLSHCTVPIISLRTLRRWKMKLTSRFNQWIAKQRVRLAHDYQAGDDLLELYRKGISLIQECELYFKILFHGKKHIPGKGKLFSSLNLRQHKGLFW